MKKAKNKAKQNLKTNPIEQFLSGFDQILGMSDSREKLKKNQETVLFEGQEVSLEKLQEEKAKTEEKNREVETDINYFKEIIHAEEKTISRGNQELEVQLKEIMAEIKKLADSSRELQMQFKTVAVEQYTVKPGKYHKTFFSWLLSIIRVARMKVEDSGAWLTAMHNKKKSRDYWTIAKKRGTSFTLNNERTVATQVG
jgi:predicted transcriptional regulator